MIEQAFTKFDIGNVLKSKWYNMVVTSTNKPKGPFVNKLKKHSKLTITSSLDC